MEQKKVILSHFLEVFKLFKNMCIFRPTDIALQTRGQSDTDGSSCSVLDGR